MEFNLKHNSADSARGACQIITVTQARKLSASGLKVDKACKGFLSSILKRGDMEGKAGQTLLLPSVPGLAVQRVLLVGCGKESDMNERSFTRIIGSVASALDFLLKRTQPVCKVLVLLKQFKFEAMLAVLFKYIF